MKSQIIKLAKRAGSNTVFSSFINLSSIQVSNILLLIILHPILSRKIGDAYGMTMVANSFGILLGILVNYGTNQSGIRDIAKARDDRELLGSVFYNILYIRLVLFLLFTPVFFVISGMEVSNYSYFLFAAALVFAEVLNPLVLFIGFERLSMYNVMNVGIKAAILASIFFLIRDSSDAPMVNLYMGLFHILGYLILIIYGIVKFKIPAPKLTQISYKNLIRSNFYLVSNNVSTHLQQSIMLFAIARYGSAGWLYAYSIGDKFIWSIRILIISIANAIYPRAAVIYSESTESFLSLKRKYNRLLGIAFGTISLGILIFAPQIIRLYTGESDTDAILFLRLMSLSPLIAALNALNVIHFLIADENKQIFKIGLLLLISSAVLTAIGILTFNSYAIGAYAVLMEILALLYFHVSLKKQSKAS